MQIFLRNHRLKSTFSGQEPRTRTPVLNKILERKCKNNYIKNITSGLKTCKNTKNVKKK